MDRIYDLIEQLAEEIHKRFPEATGARFSVDMDGHQSLTVEKLDKNEELPVEAWKRRELWDQWKSNGKWSDDRSSDQNAYYKKRKLLLEEG